MDWKYMYSVIPDDLNDDEREHLCKIVSWYDLDNEIPNLEQCGILLKISQELLKFKGEQVETLLHELDEVAIRQGEEEAKKNESDTDIRSSKSRKSVSIEIENLEQRYNELKAKYKKQYKMNEKHAQEINTLKQKVRSLEHEKSQLEQDLQFSKHDGSVSSEVSDTIKDQHRELVETVHSKNKQLSDLLHDIEDVEKENVLLREKLANVRDEVVVATAEFQSQTEKLEAVDFQLKEAQETIQKLTVDNELLQEEIQDLTNHKIKMEKDLSEFTAELNKRIEDWQKILEEKNTEIQHLKSITTEVSRQSSSPSNSFDMEQSHLSALQKLLSERDSQLMEVQSRLEDAVKEMEASTELIERLKKEKDEENQRNSELNSVRKELKKQLKVTHERCQKLQEEVDYAEKLAEDRSDELKEIISQLKENGQLDEAQILEEIQELRALNRINEKQIINLVKNINKLQDSCDEMAKENSFLRDKLGIPEEESLSLPNYQNKHKLYKKELLRLKRKVLQYEEENINLRTELKNLNRLNAMLQEQVIEDAKKEPDEQRKNQEDDMALKTAEQRSIDELDRVIDAELSLSIGEVNSSSNKDKKEREMFEEEIQALCEENEALRKGMHEILNSVNAKKESSLKEIKSQTFEKLLRALDVKHISGWYHPAMRLQAEVHNVEGVNAELREQLRICRNELEELRNEKQESLILLSKRSSVSSPRHLVHSSTLKDIKTLDDLNENVDQLLERTSTDAQVCQEIASKMHQFNKDFSVVEKELEDLYKQSLQEKRTSEDAIEELESKNSELNLSIQTLEAKLKIFMEDQSVEDSLKNLSELTGENIRANLKREFLEVECRNLQDKIDILRNDLLKAETECTKKMSEWSSNDKALRNRIKILEATLDTATSFEEHQKVKKEMENLTVKFRELAEDYKRQNEYNQTEMELLKRSKQMSDDEKIDFKNKLSECLIKLNACQDPQPPDEKIQSLSKQLAESEVNLTGEHQRANHINNLYELVKDQLNKAEERFKEYENYTKDIMHKNLILQGQLKEVEDKLCNFVDVELYNAAKEEHKKALGLADELTGQVGKLQEEKQILEAHQTTTSLWSSSKEEELLALKHQVVDLLSTTDDKAVIARISSDLTQARANEKEWKNKCDIISGQLEQCHDEWLDCLRAIDDEREKYEAKERHLKKKNRVIQDILEYQKLQYHGCIPLISEQKFIDNMKLTLENNHASFLSLYNAQNLENDSIILKEQSEIELKHYLDAQKIHDQDNTEIENLLHWLEEKKQVELDLIRYRRQAEFKELQLQQCNERIQIQNDQIAKLEEDLFFSLKDMDIKSLTDTLPPSKILPKIPQNIPEKSIKFTRSQDVQTENLEYAPEDNRDDETKRCESLKAELLNTKNELDAKEEVVQQLKNKLNESEMNVSLFRKQIGDKQAQINFYEKHILELQQTKKEDSSSQRLLDAGTVNNVASDTSEEVLSLKATIKALQDAIVLKEESILQYQSLLKEDRDNHSLAAARMQEEVKMLKNSLSEEKQKRLEYEDPTSEPSRSKAAIDQYVKQVHALEQHTDDLHTQVSTLESQLQSSRQEAVRWRSLANDRLKGIEEMRQSLEEQHKDELNIYKKDSEKWREEVLSLKELINKHKNEILQVQPDLQNILKAKDDKINELTMVVRKMREEFQKESEIEVNSKEGAIEESMKNLSKDYEALKKRFEVMMQKDRNAREEIRELKGQLLKRPATSSRLEKSEKSIKEQLQKKVSSLEEEVSRLKEELAAQVTINEGHRVRIAEDFDRWKKQKQIQQTIEKLKSKLKEKEVEMEKLQQTCNGYRSFIERLEREKHGLETRNKALKANMNVYGLGKNEQSEMLAVENGKLTAEIEELEAKLEMQQRHSGGLGAAMMQEKLEAQERKLAILELSGKGTSEIRAELERQQITISKLQKSNLYFEAQNIELKMDLERSQKDLPRFREQIQHLENYIEVLKTERDKQVPTTTAPQVPQTSNDNKRVNELERTILVLKRVVERLQTENKRLLSGKRPLVDRTGSSEKLRRDFNRLKDQYSESLRKISELESALNATTLRLRSYEDRRGGSEEILPLSNEVNRLRDQLEQKTQLLDKVKVLLHRAAIKEKTLLREIADLRMQSGRSNQLVHASTSRD